MDLVRKALIVLLGGFLGSWLIEVVDGGPYANLAIAGIVLFCVGIFVIPDAGGFLDPDREHKSRWFA